MKVKSSGFPPARNCDGTTTNVIQLMPNSQSSLGHALKIESGDFGNDGPPLADCGGRHPKRPRDVRGLLKVIQNVPFKHAQSFTTIKSGLQAQENARGLTSLNMDKLPDLAARMKDAISKAGIRPIDLAKECGVSPAAVTKWQNGDIKKLSADSLAAAARALGVREEWLRTGKLPREREARDMQADKLLAAFRHLQGPLEDLLNVIREVAPEEARKRRAEP